MAKIDTTTIQGYEDMTPEQKIAALEGLDLPEPDYTGYVKKSVLDKATSDAAEWKRKYNSTLSQAELDKQKADEEQTALNTRLAELERKDKIASAKDDYIKAGFSADLASATAEAFVDGKMDVVQQNILKHAANLAEKKKDETMKNTPAPPAGGNPNPGNIDYEAEIAKALEAGDYAKAAYYSRIKTEQKKK